jgi:hypothetical protein
MSKNEYSVPLVIDPHFFIGKKPVAVMFGDERIEVKSWSEVYGVILTRCNQDEKHTCKPHPYSCWVRLFPC